MCTGLLMAMAAMAGDVGARGGADSPEENRGGRSWSGRCRIWAEEGRRRGPGGTAASSSNHGHGGGQGRTSASELGHGGGQRHEDSTEKSDGGHGRM